MATHKVRFQPVDIEIEVREEETVLNAAFRQGVSLTHGCREGQCGACKSFLLDGDLEMARYSTFALPEYESDEGYVLLCRLFSNILPEGMRECDHLTMQHEFLILIVSEWSLD